MDINSDKSVAEVTRIFEQRAVTDNSKGTASIDTFNLKQIQDEKDEPAKIKPMGNEQVKKLAEELQDQVNRMNVSIKFSTYGEDDKRLSIIISEKGTGKKIREIPSEEIQHLYMKMEEVMGMIFNEEV